MTFRPGFLGRCDSLVVHAADEAVLAETCPAQWVTTHHVLHSGWLYRLVCISGSCGS